LLSVNGFNSFQSLLQIYKKFYVTDGAAIAQSVCRLGYGLDDRTSNSGRSHGGFFSFPLRPDWLWGPPSFITNGYRQAITPEVKQPVREADLSPPSSAEAKNAWNCASTPQNFFMA
jgi:hypothetical protein